MIYTIQINYIKEMELIEEIGIVIFTKYTPKERKRLYNNYKNSALYLTIDYINLAYFLSFLILYKEVKGLNNNIDKLEKFKISLKDNYKFNYLIIVNIIYIDSNPILYIVNSATSYNASSFLKNMTAKYI
ncbi:hypothetical protein BUE80_DR003656 [Diplocarpon rosae]|nr:hypothetical protein BUE80_DR003656 [Diplocarpon rosae]